MDADETQTKRRGRKKLYATQQEQHDALRARQARYQKRRAKMGRNVDVFLPTALYEQLAAKAKALGMSRTKYIKSLIADAVKR